MKPLRFAGASIDDLRQFPLDARREAGYQLTKVQHGMEPSDWKPMQSVGEGVKEIRIRDESGAFRIIYLAKLAKPFLCCTVSRRKRNRPARRILNWRASASRI
jgi:phage-related protein